MAHSSTCSKILGIIRIIAGLAFLYFAVMKLTGPVEMHAMIGGAAHKAGLTFLSTEVWFWIAAIGELLAAIFLLTGHWYKLGAALGVIIMLFANFHMGIHWQAAVLGLLALIVLIRGPGAWRLCRGKCCCGDDCDCNNDHCHCGHNHHHEHHHHQQQQQ